jgi:uncharacterized membrane protein YccC
LARGDSTALRGKLLDRVIAIENMRASAVFEDREIRERSDALRGVIASMLNLVEAAHLLHHALARPASDGVCVSTGSCLRDVLVQIVTAIESWQKGALDVDDLQRLLLRADARLPLVNDIFGKRFASDEEVARGTAEIGRLREFTKTFLAYAQACETFETHRPPLSLRFVVANDHIGAAWAGLRAALALALVGTFWILSDWPSGSTATILAGLVTARLATMEHALAAATGASLMIALATVPFFAVVEILLPHAAGFPVFALAVAPMLFICAGLMAHKKTAGMGFVAGLYFAYAGGFQDRMAYDPVTFLNVSIGIVVAVATSAVLFAVIAPDTPEAARRRFTRVARRMFQRVARSSRIALVEFEIAIAEALSQLRQGLRPGRREDAEVVEAGVALLGVGRELIRVREAGPLTPSIIALQAELVRFLGNGRPRSLERARYAAGDAAASCITTLRDVGLDVRDTRAAVHTVVALTAVRDGLGRCGGLFPSTTTKGGMAHAA